MNSTDQLTSESPTEHRATLRTSTELRAIVEIKGPDGETWREETRVTTVSRNGAGFNLSRPCTIGRLVNLEMRLQSELRAYDYDEEIYSVMALVQHCSAATVDDEKIYHVGVAFIGKEEPESLKVDPSQNYRISGMKKDGLWSVAESDSQFKVRNHPRHWIAIGVTVSIRAQGEKSSVKEDALTINVSSGGAAVACTLDAKIGDKVKVSCKNLDFYSIAVVRNRKSIDDKTHSLHVEFIGEHFPMEKVLSAASHLRRD